MRDAASRSLWERPASAPVEVLFDDPVCASEPLERLEAQRIGAACRLLVPEALHHQLQVRRLDPSGRLLRAAAPFDPGADAARGDLVEHALGESGGERRGPALGVRERSFHGLASGARVQALEHQEVAERRGRASGEAVEARERVVAHDQQDVDGNAPPEELEELLDEAVAVCRVVGEELFELIEDQHEVAIQHGRPGLGHIGEIARDRRWLVHQL